jgi:myo-inositol 2-dehydrogenase/D-chiro-inositol 1-dehydrogenase
LMRGNALITYSESGYEYAVEKAPITKGWSYTIYEESWNYGFPQEMKYFVDCVQKGEESMLTGEDGRAALEVIYAAYHSAGSGRTVALPFRPPTRARRPIDLWLGTEPAT